MKSLFFAAAGLLSIVSAAPAVVPGAPWEKLAPPPTGTEFFQLQAKSSTTAVNNQYLALKTGSSSYAMNGTQAAASKFFSTKYEKTGTWAIHNSDDTRQIVLQGSSSALLYLLDATDPRTDTIPKGQLMEWATFTKDNNVLGVKDGSTLTNRTFAAVKQTDGSYTLALYDGASTVDADISPVTLSLVKTA
ncbi:hypothetical protein P280DRAFT_513655 [Massarina eburnea CBS 473.64]|uniref:Ricin B lectin domain-containing protein n=1 Tax=Massarina eburnea CBS 473.64 TaxID=1395130 RepID=A0A6A6SH44_9PLEO|nr:hypothetical protein P280DRAFT_513655 [Massarina eburnea CBS 473.64]